MYLYNIVEMKTIFENKYNNKPIKHIEIEEFHIISPKRLIKNILKVRSSKYLAIRVTRGGRAPRIERPALELKSYISKLVY